MSSTPLSTGSVRGTTTIDDRVIRAIITEALRAVPGTRSVDSLGRRSYPRVDVNRSPVDDELSVEAFISCIFPGPVAVVAEMARRTIAGAASTYLGLHCESISVVVGDICPAGHDHNSVSEADIHAFEPIPTPRRPHRRQR